MGRHNLMNTLAAVAVADLVGLKPSQLDHAIATFKGVRRRQEVRGVVNDISIIDDFAHHPTAVKETLEAVRPFCNNRLVAVFEPRTNTSMRCVFQQAYSQVFAPADLICIRAPSMLHKVPPRNASPQNNWWPIYRRPATRLTTSAIPRRSSTFWHPRFAPAIRY